MTNPPYRRDVLHQLIPHFQGIAVTGRHAKFPSREKVVRLTGSQLDHPAQTAASLANWFLLVSGKLLRSIDGNLLPAFLIEEDHHERT